MLYAADQRPALNAWRWRVFAATWACYAGFYFCRKPFSSAKASLGSELHFSDLDLANVYAVYLVTYAAGQFLSSWLGPRLGPRRMLLGGMAISVLSSVGFGLATTVGGFAVLMAINGFAQATGWSNNVGTMAAWFHRGERGTVMGWWATNFQVGGFAATLLAGWSMQHPEWIRGLARQFGVQSEIPSFRVPFFAGAGVLACVMLLVWAWQRNRPEDVGLPPVEEPHVELATTAGARPARAVAAAGRDRGTWTTVLLVAMAYFALKFVRYAMWSWGPFLLQRNFHLAKDEASYWSTVFDVAGTAGVIATGWLSDKVFGGRRAKVSLWMLLGMVAATGLLFTVGQTSVALFIVCLGLVGFTLFGPDALLTGAGAMDIGSREGAVRAAGIISGIGSVGSAVQELAIGKALEHSKGALGPVLAMLAAAAVMAATCVGVILWRNRRGDSDM
jgi:sugar phosphate permease